MKLPHQPDGNPNIDVSIYLWFRLISLYCDPSGDMLKRCVSFIWQHFINWKDKGWTFSPLFDTSSEILSIILLIGAHKDFPGLTKHMTWWRCSWSECHECCPSCTVRGIIWGDIPSPLSPRLAVDFSSLVTSMSFVRFNIRLCGLSHLYTTTCMYMMIITNVQGGELLSRQFCHTIPKLIMVCGN